MAPKIKTLKERLERRIIITPGCWIWTGGVAGNNKYGSIGSYSLTGKWKTLTTHRVSYEIYVGEIPKGLNVLHKCDRPTCVNPDHLFLGTHFDNMRDMVSKKRHKLPDFRIGPKGEKNRSSKLTEKDVLAIRDDERYNFIIAKEYKDTGTTIGMIKNRKTWRHI